MKISISLACTFTGNIEHFEMSRGLRVDVRL